MNVSGTKDFQPAFICKLHNNSDLGGQILQICLFLSSSRNILGDEKVGGSCGGCLLVKDGAEGKDET